MRDKHTQRRKTQEKHPCTPLAELRHPPTKHKTMDIIVPTNLQESPTRPSHPDPAELSLLASLLREAIDPRQIISFGSLAGAMPHSDMVAYDLLAVTADRPSLDWLAMRDYFRFKYPRHSRTIPFTNLYICSESDINGQMSLFYRFAQSEGEILYTWQPLRRKQCDYQALHFKASERFEFSSARARSLIGTAKECLKCGDHRQGVFLTAYAAETSLRGLYAAYHGCEADLHELPTLFLRTHTLSTRLTMLLDPEQSSASRMLARLENFRRQVLYSTTLEVNPAEVADYLRRTEQMNMLIEQQCHKRLALYLERVDPSETRTTPIQVDPSI